MPPLSTAGVDLESELEEVHTELRNFLLKKRARKAGGQGGLGLANGEGGAGAGGDKVIALFSSACPAAIVYIFCYYQLAILLPLLGLLFFSLR